MAVCKIQAVYRNYKLRKAEKVWIIEWMIEKWAVECIIDCWKKYCFWVRMMSLCQHIASHVNLISEWTVYLEESIYLQLDKIDSVVGHKI